MSDEYGRYLEDALRGVYRRLAAEGSVPPAQRHRAEGVAMTGLRLGLIDVESLVARLERAHTDELGVPFQQRQGRPAGACIDPGQTVTLPTLMSRAPVVPSTRDED